VLNYTIEKSIHWPVGLMFVQASQSVLKKVFFNVPNDISNIFHGYFQVDGFLKNSRKF
jgi:hypothetical protein